ncbi:MAG: hypothetical protein ACK56Y_10900 [Pseudanabaena sp.]
MRSIGKAKFSHSPRTHAIVSYSLGDAIDWKQVVPIIQACVEVYLLLARERDRLETPLHRD